MPGGDRTGPLGQGPMTGRQLGFCLDQYQRGNMFRQMGGGFGRGNGMGFRKTFPRFNQPYPEAFSSEKEVEVLNKQAKSLRETLIQVEKRLSQLEKESVEEKK